MRTILIYILLTLNAQAQVAGWFTNTDSGNGAGEPGTFYNQLMMGFGTDEWRLRVLADDPTSVATFGNQGDIGSYSPSGLYRKSDGGTTTNWALISGQTTGTPTGIFYADSGNAPTVKETNLAFDDSTDTLVLIGTMSHTGTLDHAGDISSTGNATVRTANLELLGANPATQTGMVVYALAGDNNSIFSRHPDGTITDYSIATTPTSAFCVLYHDEPQGTAGDNLLDDVWDTRTLNATDSRTDCSFLGLSNDQITITQTGRYRGFAEAWVGNANIATARLLDVSAGSGGSLELGRGSTVNTNGFVEFPRIMYEFSVTGAYSSIIELQTIVSGGGGAGQGGTALNGSGIRERYSQMIIEKVQ